jgi:predicted RNase H-like HicB family nuclease
MKKKFSVLVEKDEDGYFVATVPTLPGCHTQARSMDDLLERAKEAIEAYLEAYTGSKLDLKDGEEVELTLTKKISERTFGLITLDHDIIEEIIEDTEYGSW